jgi:hypothetical protein
MSNYSWQRLGAASGIISVMILLARDSIPAQTLGTEADEIARTCTSSPQAIDVTMSLLGVLGFLGFLFFFGSLWSVLRRAEGEAGWLSASAFGGGVTSIAVLLAGGVGSIAAHYNACDGIDLQLWQTLHDMGSASFYTSFFPLAVLLGASAVVIIRFGTLPRWLGWMTAALAVLMLYGGMAGTIYLREDAGLPYLLFELWIVITSIAMMRRERAALPTVSATLTSPANETG